MAGVAARVSFDFLAIGAEICRGGEICIGCEIGKFFLDGDGVDGCRGLCHGVADGELVLDGTGVTFVGLGSSDCAYRLALNALEGGSTVRKYRLGGRVGGCGASGCESVCVPAVAGPVCKGRMTSGVSTATVAKRSRDSVSTGGSLRLTLRWLLYPAGSGAGRVCSRRPLERSESSPSSESCSDWRPIPRCSLNDEVK